ncbi:squalene/phytoene synthase family protein [Corynebacterium sp. 4HC-13]|uniref:Phytoene/squalene synthase family protein n=2 Tax=Corynebacterium anserum TaxID=2684406 RepID=A0A7G7YRA7_9CORY|nr:squalene/phytoene synthase family protein [Corynebacterium anserum]QNH97027.1 phytoene/squalene synthase family protein [Corynebacterium anserum]
MAQRSAHQVINTYSSSFGLATALLSPAIKSDIRNLYAMVRIADEIVDGSARQAGVRDEDIATLLDNYERAVIAAPASRFHVDPVLHAYAGTARRCGIRTDDVRAFFRSMRTDLSHNEHSDNSLDDYIYGSAEVIGVMCVDIFLAGRQVTPDLREQMDIGARSLGAAFQKINFLRDYAEDTQELGRVYFPACAVEGLTDGTKKQIVADIRDDLTRARTAIPLLPLGARMGVLAATKLFENLTDKVDSRSAAALHRRRIRISAPHKMWITAQAIGEALWMSLFG